MENEKLTALDELILPWARVLQVSELEYDTGLKMLRLRLREGKHRFTIVDIDADNVKRLAALFNHWAAGLATPADGENDGE